MAADRQLVLTTLTLILMATCGACTETTDEMATNTAAPHQTGEDTSLEISPASPDTSSIGERINGMDARGKTDANESWDIQGPDRQTDANDVFIVDTGAEDILSYTDALDSDTLMNPLDVGQEDAPALEPCEFDIPAEATWKTGIQNDGTYLLPGGRVLERLGVDLETGGFPSDMISHPELSIVYLTVAGRYQRELIVFDALLKQEVQRIQRNGSFYGMEISPEGEWLYVSGGATNVIERFPIDEGGSLGPGETLAIEGLPSGMALSSDGKTLWVGLFGGEALNPIAGITEVNTAEWTVNKSLDLDAIVWDLLLLPNAQQLYASDLGGNGIYVIDIEQWEEVEKIEVPTSPAGMELNTLTNEVLVAVSGTDVIATIDPQTHLVTQWTPVTDLAWVDKDGAPLPYSNVNALDYDPSTNRLYASRGADNAVSVFSAEDMSLLGAFPTAWYPTSVVIMPESQTAVVAEGKGYGKGPDDIALSDEELEQLKRDGSVSFIDLPSISLTDTMQLANEAFGRPGSLIPECDGFFPVPLNENQKSPIEHIILVVKENKTFDCVFGDLEDMDVDADPSLVRWGEDITPNQHALAKEFCLCDNFYAEVPNSDTGHVFLTAGHLTEFTERIWKEESQYGLNATFSISEPTIPAHGNLFSHLIDHGISTRIYGEVVGLLAKTKEGEDVISYTDMAFPGGFIVNYNVTDTEKAEYVISRIEEGELAQFTYLLLPNDHTNGTAPGTPSPESMVADNDFAVGRLVEAVSNSGFWDKTLIIITQDDTQGCDDHVDLHRSFTILVSPWVKRNHVSHVHTSFPSIMSTVTRVLGAPPMGRADATAMPFIDCFAGTKNSEPMESVPRTYPPELNPTEDKAPGANKSAQMNWRSPDRNPGLGIILDAYRLWKMGHITRAEAEERIRSGAVDEELWEEWIEESHEDTIAFDRALARLKARYPEKIPERLLK